MSFPARSRSTKPTVIEPSKSELTRQRILDSAAVVFAERGYAHARLSDVARQAGSHAGGIYYYFASREALVEEVLRICTERALADLRAELDKLPANASAAQRIVAGARSQLAGIMSNDPYIIAYNHIFLQVPEDVRLRHRKVLQGYFGIWRNIIRDGQASGELRSDLKPSIIRLTITGAIQWATQWAVSGKDTPDDLAQQMVDMLLHGALSQPADKSSPA